MPYLASVTPTNLEAIFTTLGTYPEEVSYKIYNCDTQGEIAESNKLYEQTNVATATIPIDVGTRTSTTYWLAMYDSYGDSWNGNKLTIRDPVLTNVTYVVDDPGPPTSSGKNPVYTSFVVPDTISGTSVLPPYLQATFVAQGSSPGDISYAVYNCDTQGDIAESNKLYQSTIGDVSAQQIPLLDPPQSNNYWLVMMDSVGDGWNGATLTIATPENTDDPPVSEVLLTEATLSSGALGYTSFKLITGADEETITFNFSSLGAGTSIAIPMTGGTDILGLMTITETGGDVTYVNINANSPSFTKSVTGATAVVIDIWQGGYTGLGGWGTTEKGALTSIATSNDSATTTWGLCSSAPSTLTSLADFVNGCTNITSVPSYCPSTITTLHSAFRQANSFNGDISSWDVSQCTDFNYMFYQNTAFNQSLNGWTLPTTSTYTMYAMFQQATSFNGDISTWNVSQCTSFQYMFYK